MGRGGVGGGKRTDAWFMRHCVRWHKSARRGHVKLKPNPSDSDRSEIQVDVVDLAPGSRPFFEESTPAAGFGPPLES